jgi:nucleoid-associated protein YgaU
MGIFDKMFGHGAAAAQAKSGVNERFDQLKQKYQSVLNMADQQQIQFQNLHIQDDKLFIKGTAPSEDAKNRFWDQIKLVNPNTDDITADISVQPQQQSSTQSTQTYTVVAGDNLSKISKHFYGDPGEYMRIFYANRDKLSEPDKIQVGQVLVIPSDKG